MPERPTPDEGPFDDRSPYVTIEAIMRTVARLAPDVPDEDAAWEDFITARGGTEREYFEAIRRSRHSVFLYQHQQFYEFGIARTKSDPPETFCAAAGRLFMETFFLENVYPFLRVALAQPEAFQPTIIEMLATYLQRYAGGRYLLASERAAGEITISLEIARPELAREQFEDHELDPKRSFSNSFHFIAAAFDAFLAQVVSGYESSRARFEVDGLAGRMRFPVR
ncbi:MAG: hypothetical protein ACYS9X_15540, partial [Planctomycetota bacterium]